MESSPSLRILSTELRLTDVATRLPFRFGGAVLNAAKEIASEKFIAGEIKFLEITLLVEEVLKSKDFLSLEGKNADTFDVVLQTDLLTRDIASNIKLK